MKPKKDQACDCLTISCPQDCAKNHTHKQWCCKFCQPKEPASPINGALTSAPQEPPQQENAETKFKPADLTVWSKTSYDLRADSEFRDIIILRNAAFYHHGFTLKARKVDIYGTFAKSRWEGFVGSVKRFILKVTGINFGIKIIHSKEDLLNL